MYPGAAAGPPLTAAAPQPVAPKASHRLTANAPALLDRRLATEAAPSRPLSPDAWGLVLAELLELSEREGSSSGDFELALRTIPRDVANSAPVTSTPTVTLTATRPNSAMRDAPSLLARSQSRRAGERASLTCGESEAKARRELGCGAMSVTPRVAP